MHISLGVQSTWVDGTAKVHIRKHSNLDDFRSQLGKGLLGKIWEHSGLTLATQPVYHFNVGHALFDGFYPAFVSLLQLGLEARRFRVFVLSGHLGDVERRVPGMYDKMEKIFGEIGGLGNFHKRDADYNGTS